MASPSTSILHQASELNEDGIYELASGHSGLAIDHLQEAARLLMQCLSSPAAAMMMEESSSASPRLSTTTCRVQIPHLQDDLFYIYSCAVSYTPPPPQRTTSANPGTVNAPSRTDLIFGLVVVLFNLGLAYHQRAKTAKQQQNEEASLRQALTYYKECQQALQSLNSHNNNNNNMQEDDDDLLLLTLAVMNNQAQIIYELGGDERNNKNNNNATSTDHAEDEGEDPVFQKLLTCSMHAILSADENLSMVEQSQIHEFVQNAMVFRLQRSCAAPSA